MYILNVYTTKGINKPTNQPTNKPLGPRCRHISAMTVNVRSVVGKAPPVQ